MHRVELSYSEMENIVDSLEAGIENTRELLVDHDERLGRTTAKNRFTAERMEKEISKMEKSLGYLK